MSEKSNISEDEKEDIQLEDEKEDIQLEDDKKQSDSIKEEEISKSQNNDKNEEEEEENYDVEKVLNHRVKYKKLQFYLKWVGWSENDNTWEDFENLNCPEKIIEYRNKVISDSSFDVLSLLSYGQRLLLPDMFKDDPSVYQDIKYRKVPPVKGEKKVKKKSEVIKEKKKYKVKAPKIKPVKIKPDKKLPSKMPDFEVISPDFQTANPLLKIEGVFVKDGEIFYKVKRRKLPSEIISSKVLKVTYPESLASYLNDLFVGNE